MQEFNAMLSPYALLIGLSLSLVISGCLPIPIPKPPPYLSKGEIQTFSGRGCTVTIVTSNQFGKLTDVEIAVWQNVLAKIGRNEYAKFQLPVGSHSLSVVWGEWGIEIVTGLVSSYLKRPKVYSDYAQVDCNDGENILYGISYNASTSDRYERYHLKQITDFDEDFNLVGKTLVPIRVEN